MRELRLEKLLSRTCMGHYLLGSNHGYHTIISFRKGPAEIFEYAFQLNNRAERGVSLSGINYSTSN